MVDLNVQSVRLKGGQGPLERELSGSSGVGVRLWRLIICILRVYFRMHVSVNGAE